VNQAYFWAIDEEHDLTFYENVMSRRGVMQGLEYRHAENSRTKGDWRLDFLNDRRSAASLYNENSDLRTDGLSRSNSNRWWLRSKYNGFVVDPAWNFKLDLDMVSDQNYLREFSSGISGFESSRLRRSSRNSAATSMWWTPSPAPARRSSPAAGSVSA